ncbi:MAG: hypothetical protein HY329_23415, partial [Chloroflexi bacterium]|nr:hypothetical protein [Chloroflexota bacterium]
MSELTIEAISSHLERIEEQCRLLQDEGDRLEQANQHLRQSSRRWQRAGLAGIVVASLLAVGGSSHAVHVEAQIGQYSGDKYEVVDSAGKTRGRISVDSDGSTGVLLYAGEAAREKIPTAIIVAPDGESGVVLTDGAGNLRLLGGTSKDSPMAFDFLDTKFNSRIRLELSKEGDGKIS